MSKETFNSTRFNKSKNKPFEEVLDANLSRRNVLKGGLGISAMTAFGAFGLSGCNSSSPDSSVGNGSGVSSAVLNFDSIPGSLTDAVSGSSRLHGTSFGPWGTPLNAG
ncbi:twin-arginine translocation signal domain-containing protein [Vibrio lentus]|nr:twin-arginine translocation signal domain-containing protein [Vibrio lentus]